MLRWNDVADKTIFGLTVKMYREPFTATDGVVSIFKNLDIDHYAYKYYGTELLAYRVLDTNFESYMEERGDVERMKKVVIPTIPDRINTVL